jgi:hypothetical protein
MSKHAFIVQLLLLVFLISFGRGKGEESQSRNSDDDVGIFVESDEANTIYRKIARHLGFQGDPNSQDCLTFVEDKLTIEFHPSHSPVYIVGKELLDLFPNYKPVIVVCNRDATTWIARLNAIALAARSTSKTEFAYEFIAEFDLLMREHFDKCYFAPDEVCKEIEINPEGLIDRLHSIRESAKSFKPTADILNPMVDDLLALVHRHFSDLPDDFDLKFLRDSYIRSAREALATRMDWNERNMSQQDFLMQQMLEHEFSDTWRSHHMIPKQWKNSAVKYLCESRADVQNAANTGALRDDLHTLMQREIKAMVVGLSEATKTQGLKREDATESRKAQMTQINAAYADYMLTIAELKGVNSRKMAIEMMNEKRENVRQHSIDRIQKQLEMRERMNKHRRSLGLPELTHLPF